MKTIFKITSYVILSAFFCVALSGCGKQTSTTSKKIIVWSFEDEDLWKSVARDFEKNNSGYTLVYEKQTLDNGYENRVLNSILSGEGPDVWSMPNDWVYRHKEKLASMPETLSETINMDEDFVKSVKQSVVFDNKVFALTPTAQPLIVYYNQKLIDKTIDDISSSDRSKEEINQMTDILSSGIPTTWTDFVKFSSYLTVKNGNSIAQSGAALGTANISNADDILYLLMLQNGTQITSSDYSVATINLPNDTATGATDSPGKRALDFYTSFSDPTSANYSWNDSLGNDIDAFANGKTAIIFGYSDLQNTLLQKYPDFSYKKMFVPQLTSDSASITDLASFNAFGVSKYSSNVNASWNLVYSLSTELSPDFSSGTKQYVSEKSSSYDVSITNRTSNNPEKLELATAQSIVKNRYPEEFNNAVKKMITMVTSRQTTSQNALDITANNVTNIIRSGKW